MSRAWLAALGAAAIIACGDDGNGPSDSFPDVAGFMPSTVSSMASIRAISPSLER